MKTFEEFGGFLLLVSIGALGLIYGVCVIVYSLTWDAYAPGVAVGILMIVASIVILARSLVILSGHDDQEK